VPVASNSAAPPIKTDVVNRVMNRIGRIISVAEYLRSQGMCAVTELCQFLSHMRRFCLLQGLYAPV
jgi:hypothetical protein